MLKVVVAQKAKLLTTRMNAYRSQCALAFTKDLHLTQDIRRFVQELNIWIYGEIRDFCLFGLNLDLDFDIYYFQYMFRR